MGSSEGLSLEIDTVSQNRLNAIKKIWFFFNILKNGSTVLDSPLRDTLWDKVSGLDEPYPMS